MGGKASTQAPPVAPAAAAGAPQPAVQSKSGAKIASAPPQAAPPSSSPVASGSPAPPAAAEAPSGGGLMGQMGKSLATGMATGVGMAAADRAVDAVLGPRQVEVVHSGTPAPPPPPPPPKRCDSEREQLMQCIRNIDAAHIQDCESHMDAVKRCEV
uniref:CHCH domain-containing protein n=1 Tax=Alexandrium monilatum TaxID=311494 RepID=A0A7S4VXW3_9DINO|mmetsp:Transcript_53269/g.158867  ORF Transcript_53269/g.158867 Transcript_53269/m.158867 type:complete len:156 (-) Transcript_53269:86-553(-)